MWPCDPLVWGPALTESSCFVGADGSLSPERKGGAGDWERAARNPKKQPHGRFGPNLRAHAAYQEFTQSWAGEALHRTPQVQAAVEAFTQGYSCLDGMCFGARGSHTGRRLRWVPFSPSAQAVISSVNIESLVGSASCV